MVGNIVVCASQIGGRCNEQGCYPIQAWVVCASQIEGRCNSKVHRMDGTLLFVPLK